MLASLTRTLIKVKLIIDRTDKQDIKNNNEILLIKKI